ncbi:MAG: LCP family protein [bacterium]|nr:LCP family protein [bacterium]
MLKEYKNINPPEKIEKKPLNFLETGENSQNEPTRKSWKRFFVLGIFLLLFSIFVIRTFTPPAVSDNPYEYDPITLEPNKADNILMRITNFVFKRQAELEGHKDDRINILLLGMGGPGHNGPYLTDTIIIVSIKPSTGQIAMVSVPRDLGVNMPDYGIQKINNANAYGEAKQDGAGAVYATKIIENSFDIKLPYYARVDFQAFEDVIDSVGGIKIDVEKTFTDYEFPAPNDNYQSLTFTKGVQTMDGERALQYTRSRHGNNGEGSDFARAKRQQKVILSLKEKVLSFQTLANPIKISKIIQSLGNHVSTNIEFSNMISLLKIGRSADLSNIVTLVFDIEDSGLLESSYTAEGAYILSPVSGNFEDMKNAIKNIFDYTGEKDTTPSQDTPAPESINIEVENPNKFPNNYGETIVKNDIIEIKNGTWRAGLAARVKELLLEQNLEIGEISNTLSRPVAESSVYVMSTIKNTETIEKIQATLNIPLQNTIANNEEIASSTDILVILGDDFVE